MWLTFSVSYWIWGATGILQCPRISATHSAGLISLGPGALQLQECGRPFGSWAHERATWLLLQNITLLKITMVYWQNGVRASYPPLLMLSCTSYLTTKALKYQQANHKTLSVTASSSQLAQLSVLVTPVRITWGSGWKADSLSESLGWGLNFWISTYLPGAADAADLQITFWEVRFSF